MRTLTPLGNKVIAKMVDGFGEKVTDSGLILQEKDGVSESIRPRWFEVTHVGPEQEDVSVGQFVLVAHGRWTRGIDLDGEKIYMLDTEELMGTSETSPV